MWYAIYCLEMHHQRAIAAQQPYLIRCKYRDPPFQLPCSEHRPLNTTFLLPSKNFASS